MNAQNIIKRYMVFLRTNAGSKAIKTPTLQELKHDKLF